MHVSDDSPVADCDSDGAVAAAPVAVPAAVKEDLHHVGLQGNVKVVPAVKVGVGWGGTLYINSIFKGTVLYRTWRPPHPLVDGVKVWREAGLPLAARSVYQVVPELLAGLL